jgi:hypothetical protein
MFPGLTAPGSQPGEVRPMNPQEIPVKKEFPEEAWLTGKEEAPVSDDLSA